jgi:hypothetical protein
VTAPVTNISLQSGIGGTTIINLNIDVAISVKPDELNDLGTKIKSLIEAIRANE